MSEFRQVEREPFLRQDVEQIVAELGLEDGEIAGALVAMRPSAGQGLRRRVRAITEAEQPKGRVLPFLPRLVVRVGAAAVVFLVVVFLLITAVPSARAAFGRFIQERFQQRFGLVLYDTSQEELPMAAAESGETGLEEGESVTEIGEAVISPLSLEEAQAQVGFTIPTPFLLPEGFALWNTRVFTGPQSTSMDEAGNMIGAEPPVQVLLFFKPDEANKGRYHPEATLSLTIFDQTDMDGGYGAPMGHEAAAEVNGNEAVFVRGIWELGDENNPPPGYLIWDDTAEAGMLSWEADGFTFILQASNLRLLLEEFIRIAESIG